MRLAIAGGILKAALADPDVGSKEEAHLGQSLLYWFFTPVGAAVRAQQIIEAMLEVSVRGDKFANGDKLATRKILRYSEAYRLQS